MRFEKVKKNAFEADMMKWIKSTAYIDEVYDGIQLPERGTENSAGYDIRTPVGFMLDPNERKVIPTGIKVVFAPDEMDTWHLQMYVRSSVGIKKGVVLTNGTGIIDPDYQFSDNDGDMLLALWNTTDKVVVFNCGERICQCVFAIHGRTSDDDAAGKRTGGVGSTGK